MPQPVVVSLGVTQNLEHLIKYFITDIYLSYLNFEITLIKA